MMDNFLDSSSHEVGGEMTLEESSPLMPSPTDEASNPFFNMGGGDFSQTLIFDLGLESPMGNKHRLTPQDLSLSSFRDSYFDDHSFSMDNSTKRQRIAQHPTRSSSSSLASSVSSTTPSEADSDLLDRGVNEEQEVTLLRLDKLSSYPFASQQSTLTGAMGLGFHLDYDSAMPTDLNHSRSNLTIKAGYSQGEENAQQAANVATAPHGGLALNVHLNNFNLSDFISDHEQEQQHPHQLHNHHHNHQQQQQHDNAGSRQNEFMTPERPMAHRDVNKLVVRSNSHSPASSISPLTPGLDNGHFKPSPLGHGQRTSGYSAGECMMQNQSLFTDHHNDQGHLMERPGMPMRNSFSTLETLSCNPAHITPSQQRQATMQASSPPVHSSEDGSHSDSYFFSSPSVGHSDVAQRLFEGGEGRRERTFESPASQQSSPSQAHYNLWNSVMDDEQRGDMFDDAASPSISCESRMMSLSYSAPSTRTSQHYGIDGRVMRAGRSAALAASQQSSPYQSPMSDQGQFTDAAERRISIGGQVIAGIITKRSRGRRVPNNPDELNNLGKSGKVYTCKVPGCGKCFKRSEHLKRHVRSIHTDEKPFTCHCGKTFSRHDNLNQHARVHTIGGADSPTSASASLSPATSPSSLPTVFANAHIDSKRGNVSYGASRARKATGGDQEHGSLGDEADELASQSEGEVFAMEGDGSPSS